MWQADAEPAHPEAPQARELFRQNVVKIQVYVIYVYPTPTDPQGVADPQGEKLVEGSSQALAVAWSVTLASGEA